MAFQGFIYSDIYLWFVKVSATLCESCLVFENFVNNNGLPKSNKNGIHIDSKL